MTVARFAVGSGCVGKSLDTKTSSSYLLKIIASIQIIVLIIPCLTFNPGGSMTMNNEAHALSGGWILFVSLLFENMSLV